jgi:hypothetical protein
MLVVDQVNHAIAENKNIDISVLPPEMRVTAIESAAKAHEKHLCKGVKLRPRGCCAAWSMLQCHAYTCTAHQTMASKWPTLAKGQLQRVYIASCHIARARSRGGVLLQFWREEAKCVQCSNFETGQREPNYRISALTLVKKISALGVLSTEILIFGSLGEADDFCGYALLPCCRTRQQQSPREVESSQNCSASC